MYALNHSNSEEFGSKCAITYLESVQGLSSISNYALNRTVIGLRKGREMGVFRSRLRYFFNNEILFCTPLVTLN